MIMIIKSHISTKIRCFYLNWHLSLNIFGDHYVCVYFGHTLLIDRSGEKWNNFFNSPKFNTLRKRLIFINNFQHATRIIFTIFVSPAFTYCLSLSPLWSPLPIDVYLLIVWLDANCTLFYGKCKHNACCYFSTNLSSVTSIRRGWALYTYSFVWLIEISDMR